MKYFCMLILGFFAMLDASDGTNFEQEQAPYNSKPPAKIDRIRIVSDEEAVKEEPEDSVLIAIHIPCNQENLRKILTSFLNRDISTSTLLELKQTVNEAFANEIDLGYSVRLPDQTLCRNPGKPNVVTLLVKPAVLGKVEVLNNHWFPQQSILRSINLTGGKRVIKDDLLNGTAWINSNPFIHAKAIVRPGQEKETLDIDFLIDDRFPVRFYAGTDNTGTSFTGNNRFFTGVNASLALQVLFSYQFTSSYDFPEFLSHFGSLSWFLPWKHELAFFGGYSTIHPTIGDFESEGTDTQISMRYVIPIKPLYTPFLQQVKWGADYKKMNSALFFVGGLPSALRTPVDQKMTDLFQFYLGYKETKDWNAANLTCAVDLFFSPFIFLPHQTALDYNSLRPRSDIRYFYGKADLSGKYLLPMKCELVGFLRGQVASGALLPSEQYGLGGYDTVRGYQERVYLADNAAILNVEFHTPSCSFTSQKLDDLYFLLFVDAAYGHNWHATPSYPKDAWLMGVGPGIRYRWSTYLTSRLDYGFRVHNTSFGNGQLGRFHFSVIAGY